MTQDVLSPEEEALFAVFLGAALTVQRNVTADLQHETNITLGEHGVLRQLSEAPDHRMRINELATARYVSLSRMSRIVETLKQRGLVDREQAENDRRGWYAILTDAGSEWVRNSEQSYATNVRRHFLCLLDPDAVQTLASATRRITARPER
jgi:DNA-binding MarR family transcriptional regulator